MMHPDEADEMADRRASIRESVTQGPWTISRRGNWYLRLDDGSVMTIFRQQGQWRWVHKRQDRSKFSDEGFPTELDAVQDFSFELFDLK